MALPYDPRKLGQKLAAGLNPPPIDLTPGFDWWKANPMPQGGTYTDTNWNPAPIQPDPNGGTGPNTAPNTAAGLYDALMRTIWGGAGGHAAPEWYAQNRDRLIGEVFPTWLGRMDPNATYGNILGRAQGDPTSAFLQLRKQLGLGHDPSFD